MNRPATLTSRVDAHDPAVRRAAPRLTNPAQPSALLTHLFDDGVMTAELRTAADPALLLPDEARLCARFAHRRAVDFAGGRLCARRALAGLGFVDVALAINPDRTPDWPPGIVGSISHTNGFCGAVAARQATFAGIGLDVECVGRVTADLYNLVFAPPERDFLAGLPAPRRDVAATVIFSAKEAFYKCQYTVTRRWLEFRDAAVELMTDDMLGGVFTIRTADERLGFGDRTWLPLDGRFTVAGGFALTGVAQRAVTAAS